MKRIACLWVPRFAAAALVRAEPALAVEPLVVLGETASARVVVEVAESVRGVRVGMSEGELLAEPRVVAGRPRSPLQEVAAHRALLEVGLVHSPRVEDGGPGLIYLDIGGLEGLFGPEDEIARRLCEAMRANGLSGRVGIADSREAARLAARSAREVAVIPPGRAAEALAAAPVDLLDLPPDTAARLARWGLRTVGSVAALPPRALFERMGEDGLALRRLARGEDPRPLWPYRPPSPVEAMLEMDGAVDVLASVRAALSVLVERICGQLAREHRMAERVEWACLLSDGDEHGGQLVLAAPTGDPKALGTLLGAAAEARPPRAPVGCVRVRAWTVRVTPEQEVIGAPTRPHPRRLAETLARLAALAGASAIGRPKVLDTHRPDPIGVDPMTEPISAPSSAPRRAPAQGREGMSPRELTESQEEVEMNRTATTRPHVPPRAERWALTLRRLRPARRAAVTLVGGRPVQLRADGCAGRIVASAGPWRSSGEWWGESRWARDEWDVELQNGTLCRLATDGRGWSVEGIYD